jgi:N-acetylglucosaminyldiphosphoundecaprenol N-acetyl-beta-D-mannosaminyltransferase
MQFTVLGVEIDNVTRKQAVELLEGCVRRREGRARSAFFVNAHTLNLAAADPAYCQVLQGGDFVFADGTGIDWAAHLQGVRVLENMVGTDFVPLLFRETAGRGYSYFLLGADAKTIAVAADYARRNFSGWRQAGCHQGYLADERVNGAAIAQINAARPDALLVGMGNPLQEQWIGQHLPELNVGVCLGIGGLFDYWAGNVSRAPQWLRRLGHEWLWRLFQQPALKARRYLLGNPLFLARVLRDRYGL